MEIEEVLVNVSKEPVMEETALAIASAIGIHLTPEQTQKVLASNLAAPSQGTSDSSSSTVSGHKDQAANIMISTERRKLKLPRVAAKGGAAGVVRTTLKSKAAAPEKDSKDVD